MEGVLAADGTPVPPTGGAMAPIKDVEVGDEVVATDPETGETSAQPVTHLIRHSGTREMVRVTLSDGSSIDATAEHPFWSQTDHTWLEADQLKPGTLLRTGAGTYVQVSAVEAYEKVLTAYNLTVDDLHTY